MSTEKDIAERLRAAFVQHHGNKVGDPFVSQIAREIAAVASGELVSEGEIHEAIVDAIDYGTRTSDVARALVEKFHITRKDA